MVNFLLGICIGIILGSIGIVKIQHIVRIRRCIKEENVLRPLESLLTKDNIIKLNTHYSKSIKNKCIYVLIGNELKQYTYSNNNKNGYVEINTIDKPEDIKNIFSKYGTTILADILMK